STVWRDAADASRARLEHDIHWRHERPHRRARHHRLGARQPGQGCVGAGDPEHEPDAWLPGSRRAGAGRAVSLASTLHVAAGRILARLELAVSRFARLDFARILLFDPFEPVGPPRAEVLIGPGDPRLD